VLPLLVVQFAIPAVRSYARAIARHDQRNSPIARRGSDNAITRLRQGGLRFTQFATALHDSLA